MNKWYKTAAALIVAIGIFKKVDAQTHYGQGSGTSGANGAYFGGLSGATNKDPQCTFIGESSGRQSIGPYNAFLGFGSGLLNNGELNTLVGHEAGIANSGDKNTFLGAAAGSANKSSFNTFIGYSAGTNTNAGGYNTFIGAISGITNNGTGNLFAGVASGFSVQNGNNNVFLGHYAAYGSTNASNNVYIGSEVAYNGGSAIGSVAIGKAAGFNNVGNYNTFVGTESGHDNTNGENNTFLGGSSGYSNISGSLNASLGFEAGRSNTVGGENAFIGSKSGYLNQNGNGNTFLGYSSGFNNVDGAHNTYVGYSSGGSPNLSNATAIGAYANVTTSNSVVLGHKANVGIGISAPSFQLHLSSDAAAKAGSPDWTVASDSRLKKNISEFTDGLDLLKQIRPVWFQYNGKGGIETGDKKFVGIIAQEMQKIAPYTIGTFMHQDSLGNKTEFLDYDANAVTYILINSVKEQQQIIEEKEARIQALEGRLEKLEKLIGSSHGAFSKEPGTAVLEQNIPNGFSNKTAIKYFIPQSVKTAVIDIYTVAGAKVSSHPISERGAGELVISADKYRSGVHVYDLILDGKSLGAKKMVVE